MKVAATILASGRAAGPLLTIDPLSFWGGFDPENGRITDRSHAHCGTCLTGVVLLMPAGRGSSSSSSIFAEAIRRGTGPAGLILVRADAILAVGAQVAATLYGIACPVVTIDSDQHRIVAAATTLRILAEAEPAWIVD